MLNAGSLCISTKGCHSHCPEWCHSPRERQYESCCRLGSVWSPTSSVPAQTDTDGEMNKAPALLQSLHVFANSPTESMALLFSSALTSEGKYPGTSTKQSVSATFMRLFTFCLVLKKNLKSIFSDTRTHHRSALTTKR